MDEPQQHPKPSSEIALSALLPNLLTITAICAGMTAIRFGMHGNYALAVQLLIAAAILDGVDGRVARLLGSQSKMGAELDSLADFLNFGVAPPMVIYFWALQDTRSAAWLSVLIYTVCCVVRLARFNISAKSEDKDNRFFVGIPSPAGGILAMLPMYLSFAFGYVPVLPDWLICAWMVLIGLLMISRMKTWSFKTARISRENVKFFLIAFVFVGAALLTYMWATLVALCVAYAVAVIWGMKKVKAVTARNEVEAE